MNGPRAEALVDLDAVAHDVTVLRAAAPGAALTAAPLRPAMTLRARVALAERVPAGEGVSYGHAFVTGGRV